MNALSTEDTLFYIGYVRSSQISLLLQERRNPRARKVYSMITKPLWLERRKKVLLWKGRKKSSNAYF